MASNAVPLRDASSLPLEQVGGKALALSCLLGAGFLVPDGVVLTAELRRVRSDPLLGNDSQTLHIAESIGDSLSSLKCENGFVVRSSAASEDGSRNSWAGVLESFVADSQEKVADCVLRCWDSIDSELARQYQLFTATSEKRIAVLVQERVLPTLSGVAFTADPTTGSHSNIVIEIVTGDCEGLVSGRLTPDRYIIERSTRTIVSRALAMPGRAQMAHDDLLLLVDQVLAIERFAGRHVDVEWGYSDGEFWIFQYRPITALAVGVVAGGESGVVVETGSPDANVFQSWWADREPLWRPDSSATWVAEHREIEWNRLDRFMLRFADCGTNAYISKLESDSCISRGQAYLEGFDPASKRAMKTELLEIFNRFARVVRETKFESVGDDELRDHFLAAVDVCGLLLSHYRSTGDEETSLFGEELHHYLDLEEIQRLDALFTDGALSSEQERFQRLTCLRSKSISDAELLAHVEDLPWLADNLHSTDAVLKFMRHRLWANDPKAFRKTDQEQPAIPMWNAPPSVLATFAVIKEFRTEIKLAISSLDFLMIPLFTELCKRRGMDVSDVLSHYYVDDIVRLIEGNPLSDAELSRRKEAQLLTFERGAIRRYSGIEASSIFEQFAPKIDGSRIVGQVASRGKERFVYGDALCISDLPSARRAARDNVSPSSIVVTSMTQFNELDFLTRSAGIVTDEGGVLSHAAVIAREFGVPCIVGTRTARSLVQDGARLVMDMDRGVVRVISELE